MTRSIDYLFAIDEFKLFIREMDRNINYPFYHLLNLNDDAKIHQLTRDQRRGISQKISEINENELDLELGRLYFLAFLRGNGYLAQKLLAPCDQDFVLLFLAGAISSKPEERYVFTHNQARAFFDGVDKHFINVVKALDPSVDTLTINKFLVLSLSNPNRLFDYEYYLSFVHRLGGEKPYFSEELVTGFMLSKEIRRLINIGINPTDQQFPQFGYMQAVSLITSFFTSIKLVLQDDSIIDLPISLSYFLDLFYEKGEVLPIETSFSLWLNQNGLDVTKLLRIADYPSELNLSFRLNDNESQDAAHDTFLDYLCVRLRSFYDLACLLMDLLTLSTNFDLHKAPSLKEWKNSYRIMISPGFLSLLPIMDAASDKPDIRGNLNFRSPVVPLYARCTSSQTYEEWPCYNLEPIKNTSQKIRGIIGKVFFDLVAFNFKDRFEVEREQYIYSLKTRQEMLSTIDTLSSEEVEEVSVADFYGYLKSMGYRELDLPQDMYVGIEGLKKAVELHSIGHLQLATKTEYTWPIYYPALLETQAAR